jgi:hypothetical protein
VRKREGGSDGSGTSLCGMMRVRFCVGSGTGIDASSACV